MKHTLAFCSLVLSSPVVRAEVWTVDDDHPADFSTIGAAAMAAATGDTILVAPGEYPAFSVVGKGLAILGPKEGTANVAGIQVWNQTAGRTLVLANLTSRSHTWDALRLEDCGGQIRVQSCNLVGVGTFDDGAGGGRIVDCPNVFLTDCSFIGQGGGTNDGYPSHGLQVIRSDVAIYDSSFEGGAGGSLSGFSAVPGEAGIRVSGESTLFLSGSQSVGGEGGDGIDCDCSCLPTDGGDGGDGLHVSSDSLVWVFDCALTGGTGGDRGIDECGGVFNGEAGEPGLPIRGPSTTLPGSSARLELASSPCPMTTVRIFGSPSDTARLVLDAETDWTLDLGLRGVWITPPTATTWISLGAIPPSGVLEAMIGLPTGPHGAAYSMSTLQLIVDGPDGERLGSGRTLVAFGAPASSYCLSGPNSTSTTGSTLSTLGSTSLLANAIRFRAMDLPPGQFGVLFYGATATQVPFDGGFLCIQAPTFRIGAPASTGTGSVTLDVDLTPLSQQPGVSRIEPGDTWLFQFWYRDPAGPIGPTNLTQGLALSFCP